MKSILFIVLLLSFNIFYAQDSFTPVEHSSTLFFPDSSFVFNKKHKGVVKFYDTDKVTLYASLEHYCAAIKKNITTDDKVVSENLISALKSRKERIIIIKKGFADLYDYPNFRLVASQLLKERQCIVYHKPTNKLARKVVEIKHVEWYGNSLRDGGEEGIRYEIDGVRFFTYPYSIWN